MSLWENKVCDQRHRHETSEILSYEVFLKEEFSCVFLSVPWHTKSCLGAFHTSTHTKQTKKSNPKLYNISGSSLYPESSFFFSIWFFKDAKIDYLMEGSGMWEKVLRSNYLLYPLIGAEESSSWHPSQLPMLVRKGSTRWRIDVLSEWEPWSKARCCRNPQK